MKRLLLLFCLVLCTSGCVQKMMYDLQDKVDHALNQSPRARHRVKQALSRTPRFDTHLPVTTTLMAENLMLQEPPLDTISSLALSTEGTIMINNHKGDPHDKMWTTTQGLNEKECRSIVTSLADLPDDWSPRGTEITTLLYFNRLAGRFTHLQPTGKQLIKLIHNYQTALLAWVDAVHKEDLSVLAAVDTALDAHNNHPLATLVVQREALGLSTDNMLEHLSDEDVDTLLQTEAAFVREKQAAA